MRCLAASLGGGLGMLLGVAGAPTNSLVLAGWSAIMWTGAGVAGGSLSAQVALLMQRACCQPACQRSLCRDRVGACQELLESVVLALAARSPRQRRGRPCRLALCTYCYVCESIV